MMNDKNDILILGAGPASMACAMELYNANKKSLIIEKENKIGGLAKTLEFKEKDYLFRTDIGPHRFFSKNKYLYEFIEDLLKDKWILVKRKTRQYIDGKFYDYPVNLIQSFKNIGIIDSILIGFSYFKSIIIYKIFRKKIKNFEDFIISNFGRKLGNFNMLNYTEKIWGISCKKIHPDWAKQRIKGLNLLSTLLNTINKKKEPKSLVEQFYYPLYGTGLIYETISKKIAKAGSKIIKNSYPIEIKHKNNKITEIKLKINSKIKTIKPKYIVNSIPLTEFINILNPKPPEKVLNASKQLKWRSQVYLFITLNKNKITDDNWIYFPNKEIPFGRIAEMKNFSNKMSPLNKTSMFVEFFVNKNDDIWNMSEKKIFNLAIKEFEKLNFFSKKDVRNYYVFKKENVYPIYDLKYPSNLKIIKDYLNKIENLNYIGRLGRFQYTNQDHSLEMGILAAKNIITGNKFNLDKIGNEKEYFEKGYIKNEHNRINKQI
jgi:protoporphyrinogen oxidase